MFFKTSIAFLVIISVLYAGAMQQLGKPVAFKIEAGRDISMREPMMRITFPEGVLRVTREGAVYAERRFGTELLINMNRTPEVEYLKYFLIMVNEKLFALSYTECVDGTTKERSYYTPWQNNGHLRAFNSSTYDWLGKAAKKLKKDIDSRKWELKSKL